MFQKIVSLLFVLCILASADVIKQEYAIEAPVVRDGIAYIKSGRAAMYAFGPQVAVRPANILLPLGQQAKDIKIEYGNLIAVEGNYNLTPYLPAYAQKGNKTALRRGMQQQINAIYQKDELFPGTQRAEQKPYTGFLCGASICTRVLTPVQYNPVREKL